MAKPIQDRVFFGQRGLPCRVGGCVYLSRTFGLCKRHYRRKLIGKPTDVQLPDRGRHVSSGGYVIISVPAGTPGSRRKRLGATGVMFEHRYVMQSHIGRPLTASETIHHRDGNRQNNEISNLELRAGAHGVGISVDDGALAHIAYLETYVGLDLSDRAFLARLREKAETGLIWVEKARGRKAA